MTDGNLQLAASKRELRRRAAAVRDGIDPARRAEWSSLACRHAWKWLEETGAKSLMFYVPFRSELDTSPLIEWCWKEKREIILPRVHAGSGELSLHKVKSWNELVQGAYGIPEPAETSPAIREEDGPSVVFVPGLAFDDRGGRLGYGRGYYDRLWANFFRGSASGARANTVWVGTAYGAQMLPEVPMDVHDAYMDMVITEEGMLYCQAKGD
ncbi:5-formyltetrahydrofolate cyclo-ligase [Paenibacillus forsythiae]|uniref:5-formyltetrahydrofolate cyclo-ligase n=1 Tax=Paenibacillus forsythiae TaxID=365616 RepID=A0ABU3HAY3_9BACL|nr:5-formyltetrahydrofolate cyclo-ligase [Paenibacillus forsythiae]MDT3427187.1 5-formyltetrahydrofolate cyclo-ligase [Paenibacillus forsythiae]